VTTSHLSHLTSHALPFVVFIELTDHLRCPVAHPEQFLVLLPSSMEGRRVQSGELGCPVCGLVVQLADGIVDWGDAVPSAGHTAITAEAVAAFLGLSGPGGYVALIGGATVLAEELASRLPGIRLVLVNPPAGTPDSDAGSVLRAPSLPLKSGSMRGVVLGTEYGESGAWVRAGVDSVLHGLRVVVEGGEPPAAGVELLARSDVCWVGRKT
jgi:uncharacterized protein YbaR (Trm112 family)